jgi:hypothetical protein
MKPPPEHAGRAPRPNEHVTESRGQLRAQLKQLDERGALQAHRQHRAVPRLHFFGCSLAPLAWRRSQWCGAQRFVISRSSCSKNMMSTTNPRRK